MYEFMITQMHVIIVLERRKHFSPSNGSRVDDIGEFKRELQFGNANYASKLTIVRTVRPWNMTDDLKNKANLRDLIAATGKLD